MGSPRSDDGAACRLGKRKPRWMRRSTKTRFITTTRVFHAVLPGRAAVVLQDPRLRGRDHPPAPQADRVALAEAYRSTDGPLTRALGALRRASSQISSASMPVTSASLKYSRAAAVPRSAGGIVGLPRSALASLPDSIRWPDQVQFCLLCGPARTPTTCRQMCGGERPRLRMCGIITVR